MRSNNAWDFQTDPRSHHGGELGWRNQGGGIDWRDPSTLAMLCEENVDDGDEERWDALTQGFSAGIWDAFEDGMHPASALRRFYTGAEQLVPEEVRAVGTKTLWLLTEPGKACRDWRRRQVAGSDEGIARMEMQLETWRRRTGGMVERPPTAVPCWRNAATGESVEWFLEGVRTWYRMVMRRGPQVKMVARGIYLVPLRVAPAAQGLGVAELASIFGVRKAAVDEWAQEWFAGTGVRGRYQKRKRACERMAVAAKGNHNRANAARKKRICKYGKES